MPLDAPQRANIAAVRAFLAEQLTECPAIPRLSEVLAQLDTAVAGGGLHADDAAVDAAARAAGDPQPAAWEAATVGGVTHLRRRFLGTQPFDLVEHCARDVVAFTKLVELLVHELLHQRGVPHPATYDATADLLEGLAACLRRLDRPCRDQLIVQLDGLAANERASATLPTADNSRQRQKVVVGVTLGGALGGAAGALAGAKFGAALGAWGGPVGAGLGAAGGALLGWWLAS